MDRKGVNGVLWVAEGARANSPDSGDHRRRLLNVLYGCRQSVVSYDQDIISMNKILITVYTVVHVLYGTVYVALNLTDVSAAAYDCVGYCCAYVYKR